MYCRKCGNELVKGSEFCSYCGSPTKIDIKQKNCEFFEAAGRKKKRLFLAIATIALIALIIAIVVICSEKRTASKDDICQAIEEYGNFDQLELDIKEYSEIKRDTNKKSKYDRIWVDILAENDAIAYTASYLISYGRYNDGWLLENIEVLDNDYYALEMISIQQIAEDLQTAHKNLISDYNLTNVNVGTEIPELNKGLKTITFVCDATAENDEMTVAATVEAMYRLDINGNYCGWKLVGSNLIDYSYEAKSIPSEKLISEITDGWSNNFEVLLEGKVASNTYSIAFVEHDESGFRDCIVDWENTLTYKFDPDQGGWYLGDEKYTVVSAALDVNGSWGYSSGEEFYKLNVKVADSEHIEYVIEYSIWPDNAFHVGFGYISNGGSNLTKKWSCEYIEDELCLVFTTNDPVFAFSYVGGSYTDEYFLYYKAYLGEVMGTSGFYLNGKLLERNS